jgi:hypothetical protein
VVLTGPFALSSSISVGDSEDAFERMLAVLRFTFTIQLKFIVSASIFWMNRDVERCTTGLPFCP